MRVQKVVVKEFQGLGQKIKRARVMKCLETGKRLEDLVKEAGITTMTWNRIEREAQGLDIETLRKIEAVLGIDLEVSLDDVTLPEGMEQLLEGIDKSEMIKRGLWREMAETVVKSHGDLDKRFGLKTGTTATMKSRLDPDAFTRWSFEHDPDRKAWMHSPKERGYRIDLEATERLAGTTITV